MNFNFHKLLIVLIAIITLFVTSKTINAFPENIAIVNLSQEILYGAYYKKLKEKGKLVYERQSDEALIFTTVPKKFTPPLKVLVKANVIQIINRTLYNPWDAFWRDNRYFLISKNPIAIKKEITQEEYEKLLHGSIAAKYGLIFFILKDNGELVFKNFAKFAIDKFLRIDAIKSFINTDFKKELLSWLKNIR